MTRDSQMGSPPGSPCLAVFGFTAQKRLSDEGMVSPSKRTKLSLCDNKCSPSQPAATVTSSNETSEPPAKADASSPPSAPSTPSRPPPNALGLINVADHNHILSTATVAIARFMSSKQIKRLFPGAIIGRTSNSSYNDSNFVDLGIAQDARGISRKHLQILNVDGVCHHPEDESIVTVHSSNSVPSTISTSPTMLIQVMERSDPHRETLPIIVHRTRRGKRRKLDLKQGECKTLRVGDVVELRSEPCLYFCVVAFHDEGVVDGGSAEVALPSRERMSLANGEMEENVNVDQSSPVEKIDTSANTTTSDSAREEAVTNTTRQPSTHTTKVETETTTSNNSVVDEESIPRVAVYETLEVQPAKTVKRGDDVRVVYQTVDAFGLEHDEWYYGNVALTRTKKGTQSINIAFDSGESDKFDIPHPEVEAINDMLTIYSQQLKIGDFVECKFKNYNWYHGRIADISNDGRTCEVLYHDQHYEVNIPTNQNKIRISRPCDADLSWLLNQPTLIGKKGTIDIHTTSVRGQCQVLLSDGSNLAYEIEELLNSNGAHLLLKGKSPTKQKNPNYDWLHGRTVIIGRKGVIKDAPRDNSTSDCRVMFDDGLVESISCQDVLKGAFSCVLQDIKLENQHVWQETETLKCKSSAPLESDKTKSRRAKNTKPSAKHVSIKMDNSDNDYEPVPGHCVIFKADKEIDAAPQNKEDDQNAEFHVRRNRKVALPLPPGVPNMLWHALNCPEGKTGYNMLQYFLCVHDRVPGQDMTRKFWQLMIEGPKADGHNVFFKDPFRTELASQYVYSLVHHSKRLIRNDGSTLFGPSNWEDIESLMSQSIDQTTNMMAGKRLADGLHLAARGSKLLLLMFQTEMKDVDMINPKYSSFEQMPLEMMPTVKQVQAIGTRGALKIAVKHTTRCLVVHSRFILDKEDYHTGGRISQIENFHDESCMHEATECFENLGSVVSYCAYLFCITEKKALDDPAVLILIRDEFDKELQHCLDDLPDRNKTSTKKFTKILTEYFIGSIRGDFSLPLFVGLNKLMGYAKDMINLGIPL